MIKHRAVKLKKEKRALGIVMICIMIGIGASGCSDSIDTIRSNTDNLDMAVSELIERNIAIIDELYNHGLLSKEQRDDWDGSVRKKCGALMSVASGSGTEEEADFNQFGNAIVSVATANDNDKNKDKDEEKGKEKYNEIASANLTAYGDAAKPLQLYDDTSIKTFLSDLNRKVYVLNSSRMVNGVENNTELTYLQLALSVLRGDSENLTFVMGQAGLTDDTKISDIGTIGELKGSLGNLGDAQQTLLENYVLSFFKTTDYTLSSLDASDVFVDSVPSTEGGIGQEAYQNSINTDIGITSNGYTAITVRVHELSKNLVNYLNGSSTALNQNSLSGDYYLLKSQKIAVKLDYPMEVISNIYNGSISSHDSLDSTNWEADTKLTDYSISLYNGSMVSSDGVENKATESLFSARSFKVHPSHTENVRIGYVQKYTTDVDENSSEINSDAIDFSIPSTKEVSTDGSIHNIFKIKASERSTYGAKAYAQYNYDKCPTVYLTDYLEYTYFIGAIPAEKFIATGRRLRVNKLSGNASDAVKFAEIITKKGGSYDTKMYIPLSDIIDYQSGTGYYENVAEKLGLGQTNTDKVKEELNKSSGDRQTKLTNLFGVGTTGDNTEDDTQTEDLVDEQELLYNAYFTWIRPVEMFGTAKGGDGTDSEYDKQAINADDSVKVKEYGVPVAWGMFSGQSITRSIWSTWVNTTMDNENGSMSWWNAWLKDNGYTYRLTKEKLDGANAIESNNKSSGAVVIDLDEAARVQSIIDSTGSFDLTRTVRTYAKIAGMIIILYGLLLLGAWVFDTNIENGPRFLGILTLGYWQAVAGKESMPGYSKKETVYMGYAELTVHVFKIVCVGVVFILIDIFDLGSIGLNLVQNILDKFGQILFG